MDDEFKSKYSFAALQKYVSEKEKDKDKAIFKLWNGMNLDELGMSVQDNKLPGQPTKIISPFIDDNATQPDPLSKPHDWIKQKLMPRQNSANRKKEMFSQFSEETNFYIFYNVMDEEQQLWAVENLYLRGWRYNLRKEQWFKDLQLINKNLYSGKYFSIPNWKVMESSFVHIGIILQQLKLMNFIEQFQKIKCPKHPQAPISNICLNQECKEDQYFCQNCIKFHLTHSTQIIYMKQIDKLLKRHSNVNEIIQDKQGLEAYNVFRSFKHAVEDKLNQLEDELRQLILKLVNDQKINDQGYKFLQSVNQFNQQDIKELRLFLINQQQNIQNNQITLKEKESKQQLIELTSYLQDKIPSLQKSVIDQLDCVNSTFYTKTERVERLKKVWISDDGQSKPSIFDKTTIRANIFQVREKQLYLVGIFQPMLYKGSYNSTNYDSQAKTPKLIFKLHEDTNLTKYIFKQHKVLEHDKLQVVDGHLYFIEFRHPIKLLPNKTYTISISTKETKLFQTYHYSIPVIDHPLIKWQTEDLTDSDIFVKGPYVQHIYSYADIDQIPSLLVKT